MSEKKELKKYKKYQQGDVVMFQVDTDTFTETVTLTHEEHDPIDVPPGKYLVRIVQEFDHIAGRTRYVAD